MWYVGKTLKEYRLYPRGTEAAGKRQDGLSSLERTAMDWTCVVFVDVLMVLALDQQIITGFVLESPVRAAL